MPLPQIYSMPEYQQRICIFEEHCEQANKLASQKQYGPALDAYMACLTLSGQESIPLAADELIALWIQIAHCLVNLDRDDEALGIYCELEKFLDHWMEVWKQKQAGQEVETQNPTDESWKALVPHGVYIGFLKDFKPAKYYLELYFSIGMTCDNLGEIAKAWQYYEQALRMSLQAENKEYTASLCLCMVLNCQKRRNWTELIRIGNQMTQFYVKQRDVNGELMALELMMNAYMELHMYQETIDCLKTIVARKQKVRHPDSARDKALLKEMLSWPRGNKTFPGTQLEQELRRIGEILGKIGSVDLKKILFRMAQEMESGQADLQKLTMLLQTLSYGPFQKEHPALAMRIEVAMKQVKNLAPPTP